MMPLKNFYDPKQVAAFTESLPRVRKDLGKIPFAKRAATYGVGANTFRAYRDWQVQPSLVYRKWASSICDSLVPNELEVAIREPEGFVRWHTALGDSLQAHWKSRQGNEKQLSFAHTYKFVDLFVKWLSSHDLGHPPLVDALVKHANCALDSQTLQKINECLSFALPISRPSMGDVHSRVTYEYCQGLIGEFASDHGGTRLMFDYFAWHQGGGR